MSDNRYLWDRNGVFYYRRRMPECLIPTHGKIFVQSLDTKSLAEAKKRRNVLNVRFDCEFERLPTSKQSDDGRQAASFNRLSGDEVALKVEEYFSAQFSKFERRYVNDPAETAVQLSEMKIDREMRLQSLSDPGHPDQQRWVHQTFEQLFGDKQLDGLTEAGSAEIVRRGLVALVRRELAVLRDDFGTMGGTPKAKTPTAKIVTFGQVAEQYLEEEGDRAEKNNRRRQWIDEIRARLAFVVEAIGKDTPIENVDYDAVKAFQKTLAELPAHREKRYRGLSVRSAITRAKTDNAPLLSAASQHEYVICLRNVMSIAAGNYMVPGNPAEKLRPLKLDLRSASEKRPPFSVDQVKQLLTCEFYGQWREDAFRRYTKPDRAWRFWLPLIMAFTGMRPGEICQMLVGDIKKSATEIWYAHVIPTEDDEDKFVKKVVKTSYSRRSFPIHPTLIALGFLDFVKSRTKDGPNALLFSDLKPSKRGYYSDYPCRRFRESFLDQAIERQPGQTLYSLRHSFRDALRRMNAPSDVLSALGGWSEGIKVSDNYGDKNDPDYLFKYVERISYPGLILNYRFS